MWFRWLCCCLNIVGRDYQFRHHTWIGWGKTIKGLESYISFPNWVKVFETGTQSEDKTLSVTGHHLGKIQIDLSLSRSLGTFEQFVRNPAPTSL